jgi:hypothetical protein
VKNRLVIVAAVALAAAACSRPGSESRAFEWTNDLPAGAVVHLRNGAGDIAIRRAATGQTATVGASKAWRRSSRKDIRFVVTQTGNDYYICAMWRASGKCGANGYRGRQTNTFLSMFSLFRRGNDASADFVAELPANVVVDARTTLGSVQVDGMTSGVTARTTNGTVQASNVSGPLSLTTTNGNVELTAAEALSPSDEIRLTTTNGTIRAELPAGIDGNFDLSVVNGAVRSDLSLPASPNSRRGRHLQGQIGSSTRVVKMRAISGMVSVRTRTTPATH